MTKDEYRTLVADLLAMQTPRMIAHTEAFADEVESHDPRCAALVRKQHAATAELVAYLRARIEQ